MYSTNCSCILTQFRTSSCFLYPLASIFIFSKYNDKVTFYYFLPSQDKVLMTDRLSVRRTPEYGHAVIMPSEDASNSIVETL